MRRNPLVGFLALIGLLVVPVVLSAIVPIDSGTPSVFLPVTISGEAGDQFYARLDGNIATYIAQDGYSWRIGYYDFFAGVTNFVPQPAGLQQVTDYLHDISGTKIAFWRQEVNYPNISEAILVYDIATNATTEIKRIGPAPTYSGGFSYPAIGANTVAFVDLTVSGYGEVYVANLANLAAGPIRLTNNGGTADDRIESTLRVAPSGNVVVWRSCQTYSPGNCDIEKATFSGSTWTVTRITTTNDVEDWVDTDGTLIVYNKYAPPNPYFGDSKVCWQPVSGGAEQCLEMNGSQLIPSVADGLIAFSSVPPGKSEADLYVYHVATNRLFQITSTDGANEELAAIKRLPDGHFRLVWDDGVCSWPTCSRNVYGATFELPDVVSQFPFGGFLQPVDSYPTMNVMKAGGAVPVKFSLGGFRGLDIFAAGYPKSQVMNCSTTVLESPVEQTVNAGGSSLTYDAASDTYSYVWKTDKGWSGTCRQLAIQFKDLSIHYANFKFK